MQTLIEQLSQWSVSSWLALGQSIVMLMVLLFWRKQRRQLQQQGHNMQSLQRDLRALANAAVGVGERVLEIERKQRSLKDKHEMVDLYDSANQSYEQAINMARTGASISDLVEVCGISHSEAELISMMHRLDKAS